MTLCGVWLSVYRQIMLGAMGTRKGLPVFLGVCLIVYLIDAFPHGFASALGGLPIHLFVLIIVGRFVLWLAEQSYFFSRNIIQPDNPKRTFDRTIWETMSISILVGIPIYAWLQSITPSP